MTIQFKLDGVLLPHETVRMTGSDNAGGVGGLPAAAFGGEPAIAGIQIEDPGGTLNLIGWHEFTVDETACSKPRIFTGWLLGRDVSRGAYRHAAGRIWDCEIIDQNAAFSFKVFRASSAKRPAETDIVRMDFMRNSGPMAANPVHDNGLWNVTDNPVEFGEANYVEQFPAALAASVAGISGKNFYAYYDDAAGEISGYYDLLTATNRTSSLRISNVAADVDNVTTFGVFRDAKLTRRPDEVYSGVLYRYRGGLIYGQDTDTITDFIDRDMVYSTDRVGLLATAEAQLALKLVSHSTERDTITVTVQLPASEVNFIHAGERVEVKFTHIPGRSSFTFMRVIRRNVVPTDNQQDLYDVFLELSNRDLPYGPGGGDPGNLPHPDPTGTHWWEGGGDASAQKSSPPESVIGSPSPPWEEGTYTYRITIVEAPKPDNTYATDVGMNVAGVGVYAGGPFHIDNTPTPGGDTTVYTGSFSVDGAGAVTHISTSDPIGPNYDLFDLGMTYDFLGSCAGPHQPREDQFSGIAFWFDLAGVGDEPMPPDPGQQVNNEVPTLSSAGPPAVYNTAWPYADGSLRVFVDNLDQTAAIVETNPATGEFTLAFTPTSTERVRVYYQGR